MASGNANERKCFTFIWKMENTNYFWQKENEWIISPPFAVDGIEGMKWTLWFCPFLTSKTNKITFSLFREQDSKGAAEIGIEWQVALLASDGTILSSCDRQKGDFGKGYTVKFDIAPVDRADVFVKRRSEFLPQDTLTIRCKIWKTVGELSGNVQWMVRTCIAVEKRSFLWKVGHFRTLESEKKYTYEMKSLETGEKLISLDLFLSGGLNSDEIRFVITQKDKKIKGCKLELSPIDAFGNAAECMKDEFRFDAPGDTKQFTLYLSKAKSMENNDFLSFLCKCSFSTGIIVKEMEIVTSDSISFENSKSKNLFFDRENVLPILKNVLNDDFKSMLNEEILSDVKLRASSKTYLAHKCILSARSPVFKAMFTSDMKEKINECVDIEDLSDDTVFRMLQYIYSAEVEELEWGSAIQLYEASDKYEILTLKDVCSSYLKANLCQDNACEALVLADQHQDEDLKGFLQDFILKHGDRIIYSEEWEKLMKVDLKLAADTMRLKFKGSTHK